VNIVTWTEYAERGKPTPEGWHRAEWVTLSPGLRAIRYETDFDVSIFLHNVSIAGALSLARNQGRGEHEAMGCRFCGDTSHRAVDAVCVRDNS
jgi:hypothetical protein